MGDGYDDFEEAAEDDPLVRCLRWKPVCDVCGRAEEFKREALGRAWLTGHLLEEHADELPDLTAP